MKSGFKKNDHNGLNYLTIPEFEENGFTKHCFTTRLGGVSPGEFSSLNLSKTREANKANKQENYRRVCVALGVPYESLALVNYAHGDGIHFAVKQDAGKGIIRESDFDFCDAMLTNAPQVTAVTLHADCVPLFFADKASKAVGVVHAGWKGVYAGLPYKVVKAFEEHYDSRAQDILVGIGPHIMNCCFEVKEDVANPFQEKFGNETIEVREDAQYVNMQAAILLQMEAAGVPEENITCANLCTYCREDLFYSHRRDKGHTGAMGSFITV